MKSRVAMSAAKKALKIIAEETTELALLDVVLPGIDGIEVLRQIKKRNSRGQVVVMMSAYHMVDRAVESMKLGAYDYLIKPFHIVDMVNTIRRATRDAGAARAGARFGADRQGRYDFGKVVTQSPGYARRCWRWRARPRRATTLPS